MTTVIEESPVIQTPVTTPPQPVQAQTALTQIEGQPYLFTVEQFRQMVANEILTKSDKVELLEGRVIQKMTIHPPHAYVVQTLNRWIFPLLVDQNSLFVQSPVHLHDSVPEPDVMICNQPLTDYRQAHPIGSHVLCIIEVSDSSLRMDRLVKRRIYAQANIPTYWIVNIPDRVIEIYTDPAPTATEPIYRSMSTIRENEIVALVLDGAEVGQILVKDLLP